MRFMRIVIPIGCLFLLSTAAFYKACISGHPINPDDSASVAKFQSNPDDSASVAQNQTAQASARPATDLALAASSESSTASAKSEKERSSARAKSPGADSKQVLEKERQLVFDQALRLEERSAREANAEASAKEQKAPNLDQSHREYVAAMKAHEKEPYATSRPAAVVAAEPSPPAGNSLVIRHKSVRASNLTDLAGDSSFVIEIFAFRDLIVADTVLERGGYSLRIKNANGDWSLLFCRGESKSPAVVLPLTLERATVSSAWLVVTFDESSDKSEIRIRLGDDELHGRVSVKPR
ncbi:MAG TPA: hypothetical protein VNS63_05130 [Blastocatellia bacterium]|nr:hypothetical protein [Blastocatellia bacterium]